MTARGLEPEIQRMITEHRKTLDRIDLEHKQEIRRLKDEHEELLASKLRVQKE